MPRPPRIRIRPSRRRPDLTALLNLGPKSTRWLGSAGIKSRDDLDRVGVIGACELLLRAGHPASVLMAYALEGALTGCHWNKLPAESKQWLRVEFAEMKRRVRAGKSAP